MKRQSAVWLGWMGTALFVICWLMIWRITGYSFFGWLALMFIAAVLCFVGAINRSKWFLLPGIAALVVAVGVCFNTLLE